MQIKTHAYNQTTCLFFVKNDRFIFWMLFWINSKFSTKNILERNWCNQKSWHYIISNENLFDLEQNDTKQFYTQTSVRLCLFMVFSKNTSRWIWIAIMPFVTFKSIVLASISTNYVLAWLCVFFFFLAFWTKHQIKYECAVHKSNERQNHCLCYNVQSIV